MLWRTRTAPASGVKRRRSQTVASRDVGYESWFSQGRCVCFRRSLVTALGPVADTAFAARQAHSQGPEAVVKFDKRLAGTVGRLSSGVRGLRRCQRRMADIALSRERTLQRGAKATSHGEGKGTNPKLRLHGSGHRFEPCTTHQHFSPLKSRSKRPSESTQKIVCTEPVRKSRPAT